MDSIYKDALLDNPVRRVHGKEISVEPETLALQGEALRAADHSNIAFSRC